MGITYLVSGIPRYFFGDDFLLLNASRSPDGYASSIVGCVGEVGMGKWRPAFVCAVTPVLKLFGDRYWCYFLLNLVLVFIVCVVAGNLLQKVAVLSNWNVALFALVLPFSRFAWYGRISPYGLMEFGALLFALLFLSQFMSALKRQTLSSWYLAGGLACFSSLFHERYLVLLAAGFSVAIINAKNKRVQVPIIPWVVYAACYLGIKLFVLRIDPLAGGGEKTLRSSANTWILEHFFVGIKAIIGIGDGTNIAFDTSGYLRLTELSMLGVIWPLVLGLVILVVIRIKSMTNRGSVVSTSEIQTELVEQQIVMRLLLLMSGLFLILPASTIISRIEGRWLLGPEVLLLILMISILKARTLRFVLLSCYLLLSITCLRFLPSYEEPVRTTNEILEYVHQQLDGRTEMRYTIIDPRGRSQQLTWQLGYGDIFAQIGVSSALYVDEASCTGSCVRIVFEDSRRFNLVTNP
jgi:hypothetical protein